MKKLLLFLLLFPIIVTAQYKGIWNGYITRYDGGETSNYILNIKDESNGIVRGDAFIFKKKFIVFEGKLNFIGVVKDGKLTIKELKILVNKMPNSYTFLCFKNMELELISKNDIDNLTGPWNGTMFNFSNCDPGDVFLRRFAENKPNGFDAIPLDVLDSIRETAFEPDTFITTSLTPPKVVEVKSRFVKISIKDYQKIDGDIISVYVNREQIIKQHRLTRTPIEKRVRLDRTASISELIIFADNLGRIPPNTCLMEVDDGVTKQEVFIESSLQKSAVIYLKYKPIN